MDFAQVYWFRQLCIANVDNVYDRFVKGNKKPNINKEVKKRMIEIVQSGLGNFSYNNGKKFSLLFTFYKCRILFFLFIIYKHLSNFRRYKRSFKLIMFYKFGKIIFYGKFMEHSKESYRILYVHGPNNVIG
jgi:hypothetical protein